MLNVLLTVLFAFAVPDGAVPAEGDRAPVRAARPRPLSSPGVDSPTDMTGTPLNDSGLKDGTVSVRAVGSSFKDNLENVQVEAYRLDAFNPVPDSASKLTLRPSARPVLRSRTGPAGRTFLDAGGLTGAKLRLVVTHGAQVQVGRAFVVPASGGLRFVFSFGTHGHGAARPPGRGAPIDRGPPADDAKPGVFGDPVISVEYRVSSIEAGKIVLMVVYFFWNGAKRPLLLPSDGVFLPHPAGLRNVRTGHPNPQVRPGDKGLSVFGEVPPGRMEIVASGVMQFEEDSLRLRHRVPVRLRSFGLVSRHYPGVRIVGAGLTPLRLTDPESSERYLAVRGPGGPPGTVVEFNITGLPCRSRFWSKFAVGLSLLMVLAALARTLVARFRRAGKPGSQVPASAK